MRRLTALACTLAVLLGGCTGDDEPQKPVKTAQPEQTASSPSPTVPGEKSEGCSLLTRKDRGSIAGADISTIAPVTQIKGVLQCKWVASLKSPDTTELKVFSQPTRIWIQMVGKRINQAIQTGRANKKTTKRLLAARKTVASGPRRVSKKEACDIFSLLVEVNNGKRGQNQFLIYDGTGRGGFRVLYNKCSGGVHTELTYTEPGLTPSAPLSQAAIRLGRLAHERAVKLMN